MTVIICLDDSNGIMFNKRRQSRDSKVIKDIAKILGNKILCISHYSEDLFENSNINYLCCDKISETISEYSYCFLEDQLIDINKGKINKIIIYKWNRKYPGDFFFAYDLQENNFQLISTIDFVGTSHEKITKEVWKNDRKEN